MPRAESARAVQKKKRRTLAGRIDTTHGETILLRVGPLIQIPALIRAHGHDPAVVLATAGLNPDLLSDPDNRLSFSARCRLFDACTRQLACRHVGVLLGQQVELWHLGLIGLILRCSSNVREALGHLVRYQGFLTQMSVLRMEEGRYSTLFRYREPLAAAGSDQVGDAILAGLCALMRSLCGPDWTPIQAHFAHPEPADTSPFRKHFRCPLVFSENEYALSFSSRYMSKPLANVEPGLMNVLQGHVQSKLFSPQACFASRVYESIETSIRSGKANSATVAALMGVPVRTMSRHLERQGRNFRKMLDEVRYRSATRMLEDLRLKAEQIAEFLGYQDAASFARAFRRWSGKTPAEWRAAFATGNDAGNGSDLPVAERS